jgi:hypothetical protein
MALIVFSIAVQFLPGLRKGRRVLCKHLGPIIEERRKMMEELKEDYKKPV